MATLCHSTSERPRCRCRKEAFAERRHRIRRSSLSIKEPTDPDDTPAKAIQRGLLRAAETTPALGAFSTTTAQVLTERSVSACIHKHDRSLSAQ
ncbi:hypothetical protein ALC60_11381 [Trachymyrmex zeteki]|uniref:Uncharacterized protein n=1 Tax=Mycetomoellerius zeteki TaxID=64791 RepID=A0A151WNV0_9HYME|nr:hypothetical protein ALC60_11381 [Trachymyrmex zeteki]